MTAIVGIEDQGIVWMGADSCVSNGYSTTLMRRSKVWRSGAYLLGVAGSARIGDVLRYMLVLPPAPRRGIDRHLVTAVVPRIRSVLRKAGAMQQETGRGKGEASGADAVIANVMIGVEGRIFTLDEDFQVHRSRDGYQAIGSGGDVATGVLFATPEKPARARVALALRAAAAHAVGVRGPFVTLRTSRRS